MSLDLSINVEVASYNLTHNLGELASKVPVGTTIRYISATKHEEKELSLYDILWRADQNGLYTPSDIREYLITGLQYLKENYDDLLQYNPSNSWGHIDNLIEVTSKLIADCAIYPDASLHHCR